MIVELVDPDTLKRFVGLGAVKVACALMGHRNWVTGVTDYRPNTDIVYFFDDEGREIGYTLPRLGSRMIFAPNYRTWHPDILAQHQFEAIPTEKTPT